jgi:PleD family two-component response regulator
VSIGAITFLTAPDDIDAMIHKVDCRMYAAKMTGKNRVHFEVASNVYVGV